MNTKLIYSAPECELLLLQQATPLCLSDTLDPLYDNTDAIDWIIP